MLTSHRSDANGVYRAAVRNNAYTLAFHFHPGPIADSLTLQFVSRTNLEFRAQVTQPPAAADGVISVQQTFEVTGIFENRGVARAVGPDSIRILLPDGYSLDRRRDTVQVKSSRPQGNQRVVSWWLRAPNEPSRNPTGENIIFRLTHKANDENSDIDAQVDLTQVQLTVLTEAKKLLVEIEPLNRRTPAARGATNLPVLTLKLSNPGAGFESSNILLDQLRLYVHGRDGTTIPPGSVLKSLRLVEAQDHGRVYGSIALTPLTRTNPITLDITERLAVPFDAVKMVTLLADLTDSDTTEAFGISLNNSSDLAAIDEDSNLPVEIYDGEQRSGDRFQINSELSVLFDPQLSSFSNYPNPFRSREGTRFIYYLPQDSDIELKIYTLLGELVWEARFSASDPEGKQGPHDGDLLWDGRNGNNKKVLNGVYLAVLRTKNGEAMTKVAVVK